MIVCPFMNDECIIGKSNKTCMFAIKRPRNKEECVLFLAAATYVFRDEAQQAAIQEVTERIQDMGSNLE